MAASKYALGELDASVRDGEIPSADELPTTDARRHRLLSEVRHEVGNYFHKLYYWSEVLREQGVAAHDDANPTQMLDRALRGLEGFLRSALDCVQPIELAPIAMRASDVVRAIAQQAQRRFEDVGDLPEDNPLLDELWMQVDPGRLSRVAECIADRLARAVRPGSRLTLGASVIPGVDAAAVRLRFVLSDAPAAVDLPVTAEIEWAQAETVIELHGGRLLQVADATRNTIDLLLPTTQHGRGV